MMYWPCMAMPHLNPCQGHRGNTIWSVTANLWSECQLGRPPVFLLITRWPACYSVYSQSLPHGNLMGLSLSCANGSTGSRLPGEWCGNITTNNITESIMKRFNVNFRPGVQCIYCGDPSQKRNAISPLDKAMRTARRWKDKCLTMSRARVCLNTL